MFREMERSARDRTTQAKEHTPMRLPHRLTALLGVSLLASTGCSSSLEGKTKSEESAAILSVTATGESDRVTLIRVLDGDTIEVDRDGEATIVHLLNLIAPDPAAEKKDKACLGQEATDQLKKLLPPGGPLTLTHSSDLETGLVELVEEVPLDTRRSGQQKEIYAGVTSPNGTLVNAEIARLGLGMSLEGSSDLLFQDVSSAQKEAQLSQRGLFSKQTDCTLPAQLEQVRRELAETNGLDLKDPLKRAGETANALKNYTKGEEGPLLQALTRTQPIETQLDALGRVIDSKETAYRLALEAREEESARPGNLATASPGQEQRATDADEEEPAVVPVEEESPVASE